MKKRSVALLLAAMMVMSVAACGGDKNGTVEGTESVEATESTEEGTTITCASSAFDLKGSDYVQLCDYSALELTIIGDYDVDDEDVTEYFRQMFEAYGPFYTVDESKTTVGEGDIVNVDYVGKLDGVAFDGGSAEQQLIDVYNNSAAGGTSGYIDGFTEELKGASVGDVIDADVTFPENYGNTDLAGKAVVFTFTVNSIQKEMTMDDVDDTFAQEQFQVETVDEMYAQIRTYLEQYADYNKQNNTATAAQEYLTENCTVEVPSDYLEARMADYKNQFIEANCEGDESQYEEYVSTYYGLSVEEVEQDWRDNMTQSIQFEFIMDAIAEELGLTLDEEGFATQMQNMAASNGYSDVSQIYTMYGYGDAVYGEAYLRKLYVYNQALDAIIETANVTITAEEDSEAVEGTEESTEETAEVVESTQTE